MERPDAPDTVIPEHFPEPALLVWNRDASRPISAEEAFAIYENNWRHVDVDRLTVEEAALVDRLRHRHGKGFMLAAS